MKLYSLNDAIQFARKGHKIKHRDVKNHHLSWRDGELIRDDAEIPFTLEINERFYTEQTYEILQEPKDILWAADMMQARMKVRRLGFNNDYYFYEEDGEVLCSRGNTATFDTKDLKAKDWVLVLE